jgi:hypothetical protein
MAAWRDPRSRRTAALLGLLSTLGLCGCVSITAGRKFDMVHVADIRPCVTTEENLRAWFGEPYKRGNTDGLPTLQWAYAHTGTSGTESQALVVVVNQAGKVMHFALNPGPTCVAIETKDICASTADAPAR